MRPDRRTTAAGVVLIGIAILAVFDPLGVGDATRSWFRITESASGATDAMAATVGERAGTVETLEGALAADPVFSIVVLVTGLGVGLIAGSTAAYLHQRRSLQRGEHGG